MIVNPALIGLATEPAWAAEDGLRGCITRLETADPTLRVDRATVLKLTLAGHAPPGPQPADRESGFWTIGESAFVVLLSLASQQVAAGATTTFASQFGCEHAVLSREHRFLDVMHAHQGSLARFGPSQRLDGLTRAEFGEHWSTTHAPLVIRKGPLFRRYSAFVLDPNDPAGFDGVVLQWFDSPADWQEHDRQIRDEKPEVMRDIQTFIKATVQFAATLVTFVDAAG